MEFRRVLFRSPGVREMLERGGGELGRWPRGRAAIAELRDGRGRGGGLGRGRGRGRRSWRGRRRARAGAGERGGQDEVALHGAMLSAPGGRVHAWRLARAPADATRAARGSHWRTAPKGA